MSSSTVLGVHAHAHQSGRQSLSGSYGKLLVANVQPLMCMSRVTVEYQVSTHLRVSAHPLYFAILQTWESIHISAHPLVFEICVQN